MLQVTRPAVAQREIFSIREARRIVKDLFDPDPVIYWTDMLVSFGVGIAGLAMMRLQAVLSLEPLVAVVAYVVAVLAFYRVSTFTHELTHLRAGTFTRFRVAWNLLIGIPFMMPSFMYYTHLAHHSRKHYGTPEDGEYLPLATGPARNILLTLFPLLFVPALAVVRFLVLAPLGWISPRFGRWLQQHASSLVMDPRYIRPLPTNNEMRIWRLQEVCCFAFALGSVISLLLGVLTWQLLACVYLIAVGVLLINQVRTLGAHRFRHRGEELTFVDQLLDTLNYPNRPLLSELWAPLGLRFHALHHLFPSLPYHNLARAHARLMAELPADSPYRQTVSPSLWFSLRELWRNARASAALG